MYLLGAAVLVLAVKSAFAQPEVTIEQGVLKGVYTRTVNNRRVASFYGVPYARPPVGKHRFKEPVPALPWTGIYNATQKPAMCLQYSHITYKTNFAIIGSEDCLYINVHTPKIPIEGDGRLLDVIVVIHGGAFMFFGSEPFGHEILLDRDIVFVSLHYRLGPLGFLSTEDSVVPGNNGLKDQVLALKWIQKNIAAFGGNPDRVTISGLSAGSASVHYHILSPLSKGLFSKAILMSGSALNPWPQAEHPKEKAQFLANQLGCPSHDSFLMLRCLRNRPAEQIVAQSKHFLKFLYNPFSPFAPVVEPPNPSAFLDQSPIDIITEGRSHDVPMMVSYALHEGLYPGAEFLGNDDYLKELKEHWDDYLPHILDYNYTVPIRNHLAVGNKIKEHYKINLDEKEGIKNCIDMLSDRIFIHGIVKAAKLHASTNKSPVYMYRFSYRGENSVADFFTKKDLGICHGDDLFFIFNFGHPITKTNEKDLSKKMVQLWIDFISSGKLEKPWTPIQESLPKISFVEIFGHDNFKPSVSSNLGEEAFWDSLGINENILKTATRDEL